jgi:uncharacterized protein with PIN domain
MWKRIKTFILTIFRPRKQEVIVEVKIEEPIEKEHFCPICNFKLRDTLFTSLVTRKPLRTFWHCSQCKKVFVEMSYRDGERRLIETTECEYEPDNWILNSCISDEQYG